jgi:membrane protease YdiL (CAAX protease family)
LRGTRSSRLRRLAVVSAPLTVTSSMWGVFAWLSRRLQPPVAYNVGFAVYWAGWCLAFPVWVLGPRRALEILRTGRRPDPAVAAALVFPVVGGVATQLLPHRELVDRRVAVTMVATAAVNAAGEELLWRGVYLEEFPDDVWKGAIWPLAGFALWHLAPQTVLPSQIGRGRFVAGAAAVGAASTLAAWRGGGLRWVVPAHLATDACGVTAAAFRTGSVLQEGSS